MVLRVVSSVICLAVGYLCHAKYVSFMEVGYDNSSESNKTFSYDNCNKSAADLPIYIQELTIQPDVVIMGKPVYINASVKLAETISGDIDYDLDIMLYVDETPMSLCGLLSPFITCQGADLCSLLESYPCRPDIIYQGYHCPKCPLIKKTYSVTNLWIVQSALTFMLSGKYKVQLKLNQGKSQLMCVDIQLCITNCG